MAARIDHRRSPDMRYMFLIYDAESEFAARTEDMMPAYGVFSEEVAKAGVMRAADRLQPAGSATTVRVRSGKRATTDGPFAETKEQLGGYYILDCKNLDEAIAYAAKIPTAKYGSIEVRPIWEM
jgi:hypothetical protein